QAVKAPCSANLRTKGVASGQDCRDTVNWVSVPCGLAQPISSKLATQRLFASIFFTRSHQLREVTFAQGLQVSSSGPGYREVTGNKRQLSYMPHSHSVLAQRANSGHPRLPSP
ncbi:hypothetical protein EWB00_001987, partial [Schistosoma japonicum]